MSLCYTSKRQLCVGLNTSFIGLLQSSFYISHVSALCFFLWCILDVGKNQMFQIIAKQRQYREDGIHYLPAPPKLSTDHGKEILSEDESSL